MRRFELDQALRRQGKLTRCVKEANEQELRGLYRPVRLGWNEGKGPWCTLAHNRVHGLARTREKMGCRRKGDFGGALWRALNASQQDGAVETAERTVHCPKAVPHAMALRE